jgi:hypothetical protein
MWQLGITPNTDPEAKPNKFRQVNYVRAIVLRNASYRKAIFDGIFELENQNIEDDPIKIVCHGKLKVKVKCAWHGVKPDNTYPNIDLTNARKFKILENYSGYVVDNIGDC